MKLKDDVIRGIPVEVHVNERSGYFSISAQGRELVSYASTLDDAVHQAKEKLAAQKVRVSIPFITKAGERGEGTSVHAGNNSVVASIGGKGGIQIADYSERRVFKPDIPAETLERYLTLETEIRERERETRAIENEWEFDVGSAVRNAVEAKAAEVVGQEASDATG